MSDRILVTGGTGLLGRRVVPGVADLGEVHTVGRTGAGDRHHVLDLADAGATRALLGRLAPTAVIHLAGGPRSDRTALHRDNVLTTVRVLDACAALRVPPFVVVVGSAAEYGEGSDGPVDEAHATHPTSPYGVAKVATTAAATALAGNRVPLAVVRPFNVVAPDLPATSPLGNIRRQLVEGTGPTRVVRCGRLDVVRDFVPVDFVAQAIALIARERFAGITNICSGRPTELGDILEAAAAALNVDLDVQPDPALVALPAPAVIVGDGARLAGLGLEADVSPAGLAATLLADD